MSLDFVKILELPEQRTATTVTLVLLLQRRLLLRKRRLGAMCQNGAYNFCCTFVVVVVCVENRQKKMISKLQLRASCKLEMPLNNQTEQPANHDG